MDPKTKSENTTTKNSHGLPVPWLTKYRPENFEQIVGNTGTIVRLKTIVSTGVLPNIILAGPPGCGKTSSIHCLVHELFDQKIPYPENLANKHSELKAFRKKFFKKVLLELNASDDRGIDVVRSKIKVFAQNKVALPEGTKKIVFLDEVDSMTPAAQQALRRTIEIFSDTTRFCFACNTPDKLIEPIQSRCVILRFSKVTPGEMTKRIKSILDKENVQYDQNGLTAIQIVAEGDMRQAINAAQATYFGYQRITEDYVYKVCDIPHPQKIFDILTGIIAHKLDEPLTNLTTLWKEGFSALDIIKTLFSVCKSLGSQEIPEYLQVEFIREIGLTHVSIVEGIDTRVQLSSLLGRLYKIARGTYSEF